jgi:hypothetical protein
MGTIDDILAGGAGSSSRADFSGLFSGPVDAYNAGRDTKAKNDVRDAFKGGVPLDANGQPDTMAMVKTLFQKGAIAEGTALMGAAIGPAERAKLDQVDSPTNPSNFPPSASRAAGTVVAPPLARGGAVPQGGQGPAPAAGQPPQGGAQPGGATIMRVLAAQGIPNDQLGAAAGSLGRQLGMDPNAPLDLNDPQVRNVLAPAVAQLKRQGLGQVQPPQPGDNAPGQPPPGAQPQPQIAQAQPQPVSQPMPQQQPQAAPAAPLAPQDDPILKRLTLLAASPDKPTAAAAETRLKSYLAGKEPTTEMKNAAASGMTLPEYQSAQSDQAATQAGAVETAKGYVAKYQAIDDAGTKAIQEIPKLQAALKQMDSPDFYSGIGNNYNLALKRVAVALGGDPDKAAPQEIVGKVIADSVLNGLGSLKGLGPIRVAEMKLASTAAMSPDNTPQTNRFLANVAIRIQQRAVEVSDAAQNYKDGVLDVGFDKKVREMDKNKPLFTPAEVQRFQKIIDGKEKSAPAGGAVPQFSSPGDVHAAVAAGKLKSGDSFVDNAGKTRYVP